MASALPPGFCPAFGAMNRSPSATIAKVIQHRRLSALLLGAWRGTSIFTDLAVTQNFQTVDRLLGAPGSEKTSASIDEIEENNWIFLSWERLQFAIGAAPFLLLMFGDRPLQKGLLAVCLIGFGLAARLVSRRKHDREPFAHEYALLPIAETVKNG